MKTCEYFFVDPSFIFMDKTYDFDYLSVFSFILKRKGIITTIIRGLVYYILCSHFRIKIENEKHYSEDGICD